MPTQPTRLIAGLGAAGSDDLDRRIEYVGAALGHAARSQADADLAGKMLVLGTLRGAVPYRTAMRKIPQHARNALRRQLSVRGVIDLHHRSQGTAPQAGYRLQRVLAGRVRVFPGRQMQLVSKRVVDQIRSLDMARGTAAHLDAMLADRAMAELRVERRDAGDRGRRDLRQLADALQCFGRKIVIVILNRLQNRYHDVAVLARSAPLLRRRNSGPMRTWHTESTPDFRLPSYLVSSSTKRGALRPECKSDRWQRRGS